LKLSVRHALI